MLRTFCVVVILMSCLNRAALFSCEDLPEEDLPTIKRYYLKDGVVKITSEHLLETIVRLSAAQIRVGITLAILGNQARETFVLSKELQGLQITNWENYSSRLYEAGSSFTALTTDLDILNRAFIILFRSHRF